MKALIAIIIGFSSITASAVPLCLGRAQATNVPHYLNVRLEGRLDKAAGTLVLRDQTDPSKSWTYAATSDVLDRRQSIRQCIKLSEDYMLERFRVALDQMAPNDRLAALLALQIGMYYGATSSSGNLCSLLDRTQVFQLVESSETPKAAAILGKHMLVGVGGDELTIMEGGLGFIYHQSGCRQARLK